MPDLRHLIAMCSAFLAFGCGEAKCPAGYTKYGDLCRRCPPGEERQRGQCVPTQDASTEAVESEQSRDSIHADLPDTVEEDAGLDLDEVFPDSTAEPKPEPRCYRDEDRDGSGAGKPVDCTAGEEASFSTSNDDCDDANPNRAPSLSDVCGDNIDNDCDGVVDDESNNACGGPCATQLGHRPGEGCTNGLKGACSRSGTYECASTTAIVCTAPTVEATAELCDDTIDNDCDGTIDEPDSIDSTLWFEDCDGDGYSGLSDALISSGIGIKRGCKEPPADSPCAGGWTARRPIAGSTWDCDDASPVYHPGAPFGVPPAGRTRIDLNCDGVEEKEDAIGVPSIVEGAFDSAPRCAASVSCVTCGTQADGSQILAAQWIDSSFKATDVQPPCSRSASDKFGSIQTTTLFNGFCPDGLWAFASQDLSIQKCR